MKKRNSRENAIFSARKETVRVYLRSWITKRQRHSFPRFRTMYLLRSKIKAISGSWRSSRKRTIQIPGAVPGAPDGFDEVNNVTGYLNTFGVTVADRIRDQFVPIFDPAREPLSDEVLRINDYIMQKAGYSLYDVQLAVAEAVKRQLDRKKTALINAECGSDKTKIGSTALGALHGLWTAQKKDGRGKSFGVVMYPSHVTQKWAREIGETLPNTYASMLFAIAT